MGNVANVALRIFPIFTGIVNYRKTRCSWHPSFFSHFFFSIILSLTIFLHHPMHLPCRDVAQDQGEKATTWKVSISRCWFQRVFLVIPTWGDDLIWRAFFQMGWNHQVVVGYGKSGHGIKLSLLGEIVHFDNDLLQPGWNRNELFASVFGI